MNKPLVSVIIPVYNCEQYLAACINSVIAQDYPNFEIILIDDGSTDGSFSLCESFTDNGLITVIHQKNGGVSSARNLGIEVCSGELVTFVDADDLIEPQHISALADALGEEFDCSISGYSLDYPDRSDVRTFVGLSDMDMREAVMNMLSTRLYQGFLCNKLFRKDIISKRHLRLREDIFYCEDLLFCAEYFRSVRKTCCIEQATYHYRQHGGSAVNRSGFSEEQTQRMMTGVTALIECGRLYSDLPDVAQLAAARAGTECARIFRKAYCSGADKAVWEPILQLALSCKSEVMGSRLDAKEKIKFLSTCFFPKAASKLWNSRETRYL